ncbi:MAG: hypothetical protein H7Y04_12335 [Verrucomicrobia bacterium]|nr:hypothetical protein [Cytophagales bacterium]
MEKIDDLETYQMAALYVNLFGKAVKEAQDEIRKRGLPIVFSKNGKIYYELPNGEITTENPLKNTTNV